MRAVVPALLFCAVLASYFFFVIFFPGKMMFCVVIFDSFAHCVGFCMTGKSALEFGQSSVGP
jgi:hypothetical protein